MSVVILVLILALLIFAHEAGHFLVAKWCNAKVETFAIGFPPTLYKKKIGETVYKINTIPFGGYVTLHDENSKNFNPEDPRALPNLPHWQQALILLAGIVANIVLAWLLFLIVLLTQGNASVFTSIAQSFVATGRSLALVVGGFVELLQGAFMSSVSSGELIGPVGLADVVNQARTIGLASIFTLTGFISVNLAILNLIPFPALDGGRLLFLAIEKIKGSRIKPKTASIINGIGFFILIVLMIVVTAKDVIKVI